MRIPSAYGVSARSAEEHQGREQALNLTATLKLLTSTSSPSRAVFYLNGLVRIKESLNQSHSGVRRANVVFHICKVHLWFEILPHY